MNRKSWIILSTLICLVLVLTACSSQSSSTQTGPSNGQPPSGTMPAGGPGATEVAATATEVATEAATEAPTATATEAPTATATSVTMSATPVISFYCTKEANEKSVGVKRLVLGTEYTAIGRDSETDFYLVQYDDSGSTCWAWKNYITVLGNGYTLPVVTAE